MRFSAYDPHAPLIETSGKNKHFQSLPSTVVPPALIMFVEPVDSEASSLNSSVKQVVSDAPQEAEVVSKVEEVEQAPAVDGVSADVESPHAISRSYIEVAAVEEKEPVPAAVPESSIEVVVESVVSEKEEESATPVVDVVDSPTDGNSVVVDSEAEAVEAPVAETDASIPEPPAEPAQPPFEEHMAKATEAKNTATDAFKKGDFDTAKLNYMTALEVLQYVQGDLNNKQKSALFEQTVACNNNVALCCLSTDDLQNAVAFATNSLLLIRSLEKNIPDSIIWMCLQENGVTTEQLQRQWKRKALYYIGKAQLKRKNYKEAVVHLEEAYNLIAEDKAMAKHAAEHKVLLTDAKNRLSKENKREKDTWAKAFKKGKTEVESIYHDPRDTPTSSAPESPIRPAAPVDPNNLKFDLSDLGGKDNKKKKKEAESSTALTTWPTGGYYSTFFFITLFAAIGGGSFWFFNNRRR